MAFVSISGFNHDPDDAVATTGGVFIHDDSHPRGAIVHVFAEATFVDAAAFESVIVCAVRIGRIVTIDMRECTYMDCAAVGVLVRASKKLGDLLRLVIPRGTQGYRMLEVTGLVRALHVFDTVDAAMAPLAEAPPRLRSV